MNIIEKIEKSFNDFLKSTFDITNESIAKFNLDINIDLAKRAFGDINSNCALILTKELIYSRF